MSMIICRLSFVGDSQKKNKTLRMGGSKSGRGESFCCEAQRGRKSSTITITIITIDIIIYYYYYVLSYYYFTICIITVMVSNGIGGGRAGGCLVGRTLEAPIPKMSGLVKKVGPFSKRKNPL